MGTGHAMMFFPMMGAQGGGGFDVITILFFVGIIAIFYLFILRPQKKREQERQRMIASLKKGDPVVTIGGVCGVVVAMREDSVVLRVDDERDVHVRFVKSAIARVVKEEHADEKPETEAKLK